MVSEKKQTGIKMQYDRDKLILLQNKNRELHAAILAISEERLLYMGEVKTLKNKLIKADESAKRNEQGLVVRGKKNTQTVFTPLHEMALEGVLGNFKDHPSGHYLPAGFLRDYTICLQEFVRLEAHYNDLSIRSSEARRVVDECLDFLKSSGVEDTAIPMK